MFLGLHASIDGIMLKAEPPAPKINIFFKEIGHLFFRSFTKPIPSVDSAKFA